MTIRARIVASFFAVLCLFTVVSLYSYTKSKEANARLGLINDLFMPASRHLAQLQTHAQGLADDIRRYYFRVEMKPESSTFSRMVRDLYPYLIKKKLSALEELFQKTEYAEVSNLVPELQDGLGKIRSLFDRIATNSDQVEFENHYKELRAHLQQLTQRLEDESQRVTQTVQTEGRENLLASVMMSFFVIGFGLISVLISNRNLMPLPSLIDSVRKIADGDFNRRLKVRTNDKDEISTLARDYNRMLGALEERDKKISLQQKEILQSERLAAVGQLSAEVVHEIRNPLNSISLNIDWLQEELGNKDEEINQTLVSVAREISRLNQITESYLSRSRGPITNEPKTEVNDLLAEIVDFSSEEDRVRNIQVELALAGQGVYVRTDRGRMRQAILNVFKNAREAMPRGGKLRVATEVRDNVYRIVIADSGYGMNDTVKHRSFSPFFSTKPNGTGIGLAITREIVEEAQGTVECSSSLGKGTTFTFQFPV